MNKTQQKIVELQEIIQKFESIEEIKQRLKLNSETKSKKEHQIDSIKKDIQEIENKLITFTELTQEFQRTQAELKQSSVLLKKYEDCNQKIRQFKDINRRIENLEIDLKNNKHHLTHLETEFLAIEKDLNQNIINQIGELKGLLHEYNELSQLILPLKDKLNKNNQICKNWNEYEKILSKRIRKR